MIIFKYKYAYVQAKDDETNKELNRRPNKA
jgi:hypothetical protein